MLGLFQLELRLHVVDVAVLLLELALHLALCLDRSLKALDLLAHLLLIVLKLSNLVLEIFVFVRDCSIVVLALVNLNLERDLFTDGLVHGEAHFVAKLHRLTRRELCFIKFVLSLLEVTLLSGKLGF